MMEDSIAHLILKVKNAFSNCLNKNFIKLGVNVNTEQFIVLMVLWEKDGQRQQDIADRTGKDKTSVARLLSSMEKRKLIVRKTDETDSRQKLIHLTKDGIKVKEKILPALGMEMRSLQRNVKPEELEICKKVLKIIYDNLSNNIINTNSLLKDSR